ncbi:MAG TPA: MBL fold metallo-hydrolase [Myxococcales bacterium]|nr:MBL fold metallo-hydrolase [Myxococcales bacterium]
MRTSMLLIEYDGYHALTDPWFGMNMRGLPVFRKPGIALSDIPHLTAIIASHLHRDHFDRSAVAELAHPALEIAGTCGTAAFCSELSVGKVHDMAPWDEVVIGPFKLTATPAEHTGPPPPEVNFMIECGPWRIFFGGDAKWSSAYEQIGNRFDHIDVALLPIGGTLIFGHRTTMGPDDAVKACNYLRPRYVIPIHEGGEWLPVPPASWHPGRNKHFVAQLEDSGLPCEARVLKPGQVSTFTEIVR